MTRCVRSAVLLVSLSACESKRAPPPSTRSVDCGRPMEAHVEECIETTSNPLSERLVGIADVSEHEVADASGANTRHVIVDLMIFDPATKAERREKVSPGAIVAIGADEYCVVDAHEGKGDERGSVSLQKISGPKVPLDEPKRIEATCDRPMESGVKKYGENSSNEISNRLLGVANIMERDFDDGSGQTRRRLSVELIVFDPTTKDERHHKLTAGDFVTVGADEYCLVEVVEGKGDDFGSVTLRKLLAP